MSKSGSRPKSDPKSPSPERLAARQVGLRGEAAAAGLAEERGWQIHGRNLRLRAGEADLICVRDDGQGRIGRVVEVKSTGDGRSEMETRIDKAKRERLWAMARELAHRLELVEVGVVVVFCVLERDAQRLTWIELEPW